MLTEPDTVRIAGDTASPAWRRPDAGLSGVRVVAVNRLYWPDHGATAQMLTDLAEQLAEGGAEVTIITSRLSYHGPVRRLAPREVRHGVTIRRVWTTRMGRYWLPGRALDYATFYVSALLALLREMGRGDVLVAKTDPPLVSVIAALAAKAKGARLVNWCQDLFPEVAGALGLKWAEGPLGRLLKAMRNWSLRSAEVNVAISATMVEQLEGIGIARERITLLHNWAPGAIVPMDATDNTLRVAWGLRGRTVIGYSGNLGRTHRPDTVAELVRYTTAAFDVSWVFIGGGPGLKAIRALVETEGLEDRVQFRPYQPAERLSEGLGVPDVHLVSLDPACEGLILPSKYYGVLAAGRPVVFLGDGANEIARDIRRHAIGVVLDPDNPVSWVSTLQPLIAARPALIHKGLRAREVFERDYARDSVLPGWFGAVQRVGGKATARATGPLRYL